MAETSSPRKAFSFWRFHVCDGCLPYLDKVVGLIQGGVISWAFLASIPFVLGWIGFSSIGVISGSLAAWIQRVFYGARTGGLFSLLQSIAARGGLSAATTAAGTSTGGAIGVAAAGNNDALALGEGPCSCVCYVCGHVMAPHAVLRSAERPLTPPPVPAGEASPSTADATGE